MATEKIVFRIVQTPVDDDMPIKAACKRSYEICRRLRGRRSDHALRRIGSSSCGSRDAALREGSMTFGKLLFVRARAESIKQARRGEDGKRIEMLS
ncbi:MULTISPECIES: hypothetical protein [Bradyrhizobium]|nr:MULTISPECIES: hypothetical protein [Bradyrhizobium]